MRQPVLSTSFAVSLLIHAGLLGLLLSLATPHVSYDTPLRVRLVEPPPEVAAPPSAPPVAPREAPRAEPTPRVVPAPSAKRRSSEREFRRERVDRSPSAEESVTRAPTPVPDLPATPEPPPQVIARPSPETVVPRTEARQEPRQEPPPSEPPHGVRPETPPERDGLVLGGPSRDWRMLPRSPQPTTPARPSLRDQIASLGTGLSADAGGPAKQTINLDDRQPRFLTYLAHLKRRIQQEWTYPEEAQSVGMSGELVLVFTLNTAGSLTYIRLVDGSGFPVLDNEALRAVKAAAPFDAFPPHMGDQPMNIIAHFTYYSPHRYRRN